MKSGIIFLLSILVLTQVTFAIDAQKIIKKVQKNYDHIENFKATFEKVEIFQLTGTKSTTAGTLYVKNGRKYRFDTENQLVISDGKTVWTYNRINNQVLIDKVRKNSGALLPRDILFKYPKTHYATLIAQKKLNGHRVYIVKLEPKEDVHGYFSSVKIWVRDGQWQIVKIEITDLNGNKSYFNLSHIDTKTVLPDSLFRFTPTPEMNVVDMRE